MAHTTARIIACRDMHGHGYHTTSMQMQANKYLDEFVFVLVSTREHESKVGKEGTRFQGY
jgi:hypothetical protein